MKITFVVTVPDSLAFFSEHLRHWKGRQADQGDHAEVLTSPGPAEFLQLALKHGIPVRQVPMEREIRPLRDLYSLWQLCAELRRDRPDLIHIGTPKAALLAGMAAVLTRVPGRIYTMHGLRAETTQGPKRALLLLAERVAVACAHEVVLPSHSLHAYVRSLGLLPPHKGRVLGSGSFSGIRSHEVSLPTAERLRRDLGLHSQGPVIGFVGRLVRDKGVAELCRAFAEVQRHYPAAQLLLLGQFEEGDPLDEATRQFIQQQPGVIWGGYVFNVRDHYPLMDVFALPTYREGFPTVSLEAAASGLAVISTTATGARDAVQPGETGWQVPPGDVPALTLALLEALDDPVERRRRGSNAQAWVQSEFSPETVMRHWDELYEEVLARAQARRRVRGKVGWTAAALGSLALTALTVRTQFSCPRQ
ncbi:glycosyltransferase [Deinococcus radiophilus]|nr:glycosyltransferase [Deinococcus radiophilus]UFA51777.1 glycosyltransferase [Deinococcus radiophilus]